jgi:HEAT repeat protein
MALVKRADPVPGTPPDEDRRDTPRDLFSLVAALSLPTSEGRRRAALDLAGEPAAVTTLAERLAIEPSRPVREAIITALVETGGETVARALAPHLRSELATVRNAAVEGLSQVAATALVVPELLTDADPDVRVLCVMVLASLHDEHVPDWLLAVVEHDTNANVCACAVDVLAEVGDDSMRDVLLALPPRFPEDPFLPFAVQIAVERITGETP